MTTQLALGTLTAADAPRRTMSGMVAPWGVPGNTTAGRLTLAKGGIRLPAELRRVKLVDYHQSPPRAIGYATAAELTDQGLVMSFQCGSGAVVDQALLEAAEGLRDAFSVELTDLTTDNQGNVTDSLLTAVALVPIPAYADARVTQVAAAHHKEGITTMPEDTTVQAAATATIQVTGPVVEAEPTEDAPPTAEAANVAQLLASNAPLAQLLAMLGGQGVTSEGAPAAAPQGLMATTGGSVSAHSPAAVAAAMIRVAKGVSRPEAEAALSDIINTNVWEVVGQDSYVGQLWSAVSYNRRFIPLLRPGTLTSWKVKGWKWGVRPEVGDYAGDKAAIPSNAPTVLPADTEAARLAGGHDLDRKFKDFGDTEFLEAYLAAMSESYAVKSDAKALAFILASASTPVGNATAAGGDVLDAAILAASLLEDVTDGLQADYFLVNRTDVRALGGVTEQDRKAYLDLFGVSFDKFVPSNAVTAGEVVAGVKAAGTFYELPGSPIRVEALDIANGGVDEALFGYWATLLHDARGIVKTEITPAP